MKKIAVVAANGKLGQLVVKEAIERDMDVTAVVRGGNRTETPKAIVKDIASLEPEDLADFDAVISTYSNFSQESPTEYIVLTQHLCDCVADTPTHLIVVGGAGSLYVNPEHTMRVMDGPDFPEAAKPIVAPAADALDAIRKRDDVAWTFVSPALDFQVDGERTGAYVQAGEELVFNAAGESRISYADFAIALVDIGEGNGHLRQRISFFAE